MRTYVCLCEFLCATCIRVPSEVRRDHTPWSWRYRRLYAVWGWCGELNLCSSGKPGTVSTLNQWLMSLALLLFLLIYTGFHLQPSVATMFFSFPYLFCVWAWTCWSQGQPQEMVPFPTLQVPEIDSGLQLRGRHSFLLNQLVSVPSTNCYVFMTFFFFFCFLEESLLPVSMAPALDVSVICLSSFG